MSKTTTGSKITLSNDFHNTEVTVLVKDNRLTNRQIDRARRALCGIAGCTCSGATGTRGRQAVSLVNCQEHWSVEAR